MGGCKCGVCVCVCKRTSRRKRKRERRKGHRRYRMESGNVENGDVDLQENDTVIAPDKQTNQKKTLERRIV